MPLSLIKENGELKSTGASLSINTLIKGLDILFVGESHVASLYLQEKKKRKKSRNKVGRANSFNQEDIYFNLINKFSEIYPNLQKCLYLEYIDNSNKLNQWLKGLNENRSHYFLIDTARKNNWLIFAVDRLALNHLIVEQDIA